LDKYQTDNDVLSALGQSIHTGLRKAAESDAAHRAWKAIGDMPSEDWHAVLDWAAWAMHESGYPIPSRRDSQE
jgi:hypothetical protein